MSVKIRWLELSIQNTLIYFEVNLSLLEKGRDYRSSYWRSFSRLCSRCLFPPPFSSSFSRLVSSLERSPMGACRAVLLYAVSHYFLFFLVFNFLQGTAVFHSDCKCRVIWLRRWTVWSHFYKKKLASIAAQVSKLPTGFRFLLGIPLFHRYRKASVFCSRQWEEIFAFLYKTCK